MQSGDNINEDSDQVEESIKQIHAGSSEMIDDDAARKLADDGSAIGGKGCIKRYRQRNHFIAHEFCDVFDDFNKNDTVDESLQEKGCGQKGRGRPRAIPEIASAERTWRSGSFSSGIFKYSGGPGHKRRFAQGYVTAIPMPAIVPPPSI